MNLPPPEIPVRSAVKRGERPVLNKEKNMNSITIVGNIGKAPETTHFESGSKVVKFSLAENQYQKGENGAKEQKALWHDCEIWGDQADRFLGCDVKPGKQLVISGMLVRNYYEKTVGGEKLEMRRVKVKVQSFHFVGKKDDSDKPGPDENPVAELFEGQEVQAPKRKRA
jgi:single-strand DNA-binding protein